MAEGNDASTSDAPSMVEQCTLSAMGQCVAPPGRVCCAIEGRLYDATLACLGKPSVIDCFEVETEFDCGGCGATSCYQTKTSEVYLHNSCWPTGYVEAKGIESCPNEQHNELGMLPSCN